MNTARTIGDFTVLFHKELSDYYPEGEIEAFILIAMSEIAGLITKDDIRVKTDQQLEPKQADKLMFVVSELKTHKPIQYILGTTEFYGYSIRVNEHVLIPRPETEELVDLILKETRTLKGEMQQLNILDIGTGSGCIAVALKKKIPQANISAIDISEEALLVAKANAILNQTKISFLQADILALALKGEDKADSSLQGGPEGLLRRENGFNIIVSNPPYIRISEKEKMSKNVLDFEPHMALFVENDDPLLFYKHITDFALKNLVPGGKLYFEINELLGSEVKKMLEEKGFKNIEVKKDMSGKDRIVSGSKF